MSLPKDLLDQSVRLLSHEKKRPKQASLRRAVSTAYYALFHLLVSEAVKKIAPSLPQKIDLQMRRAFDHSAMNRICKQFAGGTLANTLQHLQTGQQIEPDLRKFAGIFVALQEQRHAADYDFVRTFTKQGATDDVEKAREAFAIWKKISKLPNTNLLLIALTLPKMAERSN